MRWLPRFLCGWGLTTKAMTATLAVLLLNTAVLIYHLRSASRSNTVEQTVTGAEHLIRHRKTPRGDSTAHRRGASSVHCQNPPPDSPKRDWKKGDVRGFWGVDGVIDPQLARHDVMVRNCSLIVGGSATAIGLLIWGILHFTAARLR